jgi:hypothetical protein
MTSRFYSSQHLKQALSAIAHKSAEVDLDGAGVGFGSAHPPKIDGVAGVSLTVGLDVEDGDI